MSLLWRRFSPLEERLFEAVRGTLPAAAVSAFDSQVTAINHVQRLPGWNEIDFYRRRFGKVDWTGAPLFPRTAEFALAEVRFSASGTRFKATLCCIAGHIFDFAITPSPRAVAFLDWESAPTARLLGDPLSADSSRSVAPIPEIWRAFITTHQSFGGWTFHGEQTSRHVTLDSGEFLILAERDGDEFILHRLEPSPPGLFHLASHDGTPNPITDLKKVFG